MADTVSLEHQLVFLEASWICHVGCGLKASPHATHHACSGTPVVSSRQPEPGQCQCSKRFWCKAAAPALHVIPSLWLVCCWWGEASCVALPGGFEIRGVTISTCSRRRGVCAVLMTWCALRARPGRGAPILLMETSPAGDDGRLPWWSLNCETILFNLLTQRKDAFCQTRPSTCQLPQTRDGDILKASGASALQTAQNWSFALDFHCCCRLQFL